MRVETVSSLSFWTETTVNFYFYGDWIQGNVEDRGFKRSHFREIK